jgi:hypothetical protein
MPKEPSQSISISNSTVKESQLGQAGRNLNQTQTVQHDVSEKEIKLEDVLNLLTQMQTLLKASTLPETDKTKAINYVEAAKTAVNEKEPDKIYSADSLKRVTTILKEANSTMDVGQGLWEKSKNILTSLLPWLGVTKEFLGF